MTNPAPHAAPSDAAPARRPGDAVRALAADICRRAASERLFLDAATADAAEQLDRLESRDRGLVRLLCLTAWRRRGEIDALLQARVPEAPPPPTRWTLRILAAELMIRPDAAHAAVDAAVRRTKQGDPRRAGLVNAVGRRLAESFAAAPPPADPPGLENAPAWFREALVADWGEALTADILAAHGLGAALDLVPRDPADADAVAAALDARPTPSGAIRAPRSGAVPDLPGFAEGRWWVQDAAAALPARLLADGLAPGDRALDLCAAPGGKTLQLAAAGLAVTALDVSADRLRRVRDNLDRTGLAADLVAADATAWNGPADFDAALVDAPCTATGTVRRHPELPWIKKDWIADGLPDLLAQQDALIDAAWARLRPGGRLVYCTCSLLKSEGEARADAFLARAADAEPEPITAEQTGDAALIDAEGRLRCLPAHWREHGGLDGFFAFRARKSRTKSGRPQLAD